MNTRKSVHFEFVVITHTGQHILVYRLKPPIHTLGPLPTPSSMGQEPYISMFLSTGGLGIPSMWGFQSNPETQDGVVIQGSFDFCLMKKGPRIWVIQASYSNVW